MILALFALLCLISYSTYSACREMYAGEDSDTLVIEGFQLYITPKVTTRLKALKCRNEIYKSEREANCHKLRIDEAIAIAITISWKEKAAYEGLQGNWSDIGILNDEETEKYYCFLERFREIIEDGSLPPPQRVNKVQNMEDPDKFLLRLLHKYGRDFPQNLFLDHLKGIEGVSDEVARYLYTIGITDKRVVAAMSRQQLLAIQRICETGPEETFNLKFKVSGDSRDNVYCSDIYYLQLVRKNLILDSLKKQADQFCAQIEELEK